MPRVGFEPENKVAVTNFDYPKMKLKKNEHARILTGLENPVMEYVHNLRKPQMIAGVPQMGTEKRRDGTEYQTNKMDFVSRPICLGDLETLQDKGSDPKNCPACKLAKEHPDMTKEPQARYAMHVFKYRVKAGSTDVAKPFGGEIVVWSFTGTIFNQITDMKTEWKDMRKHDLLLGPCTVEDYQKFDIHVAATAVWLENKEQQQYVATAFKENQIPDLTIAVGSVKQKTWVDQDIEAILEAWSQVNGATVPSGSTLDTDLDELLNGDTKEQVSDEIIEEAAEADVPEVADDLLAGLDDTTPSDEPDTDDLDAMFADDSAEDVPDVPAPAPAKPVAAAKPAATKATPKAPAVKAAAKASAPAAEVAPDNFDDLLADLG